MKRIKIKSIYNTIPMIIIFIAILVIYYGQYENTIKVIKSEYSTKIKLIEQSIYNETKYTEIISKIAEKDILSKMELNSTIMVKEYKKNPYVLEWDLNNMKSKIDGMDIYIIDKNLKVIASSIEEEVGIDFNSLPDFAKRLRERLEGDKFESDTINFSIQEGELKKYSYIPTPDNKYLIELSVTIADEYPEMKDLNIIYLSRNLKDKYPFIENIKVYRFNKGKQYSHNLNTSNVLKETTSKDIISKEDRDAIIKKALQTNEAQQVMVKDKDNNDYRLKYIPYNAYYENNRLIWWKSYVIEILFNDKTMIGSIEHQRKLFLQSVAIISILYFSFSFLLVYLIQKKQEIVYQDHLTKLPNRKKFEEVLDYKIYEANRKNTKLAILFFDLDKFKKINDTYGHNVGDRVLQEVANRIKSKIPKDDIVSRLGGDEFTGIISNIKSQEEIVDIGEDMSDLFKTPLKIDYEEISIKSSIGISIYPDHGSTLEELILKADAAMYDAKQNQMRYKVYQEENVE